ncbi:MAG TPA: TIGR00341 family protein, partial [Gammaproteobacteria bacterium]|nr:TIGR00341 family protein [Gammaproteobacteria bacterium]
AVSAEEEEGQRKSTGAAATREELYNQIEKGAHLDGTYLVMVFLSTVVAAIGLLENNVAVVVGAMVIAPLLGPNIALAFATSLGDGELMWSATRTSLVGIGLALLLSVVIGMLWPVWPPGPEVEARTAVGFDGVVLALASGAAAVLSLTSGVASALVGVMVAVALLPPTAVLGMLLGSGHLAEAAGAALLLAVNIVCVNLSANLVFLFKGVRPRTWLEKRRAKQSVWLSGLVWLIALLLLLGILYGQRLVG